MADEQGVLSINGHALAQRMAGEPPNNHDRRHGFALVNVLPEKVFRQEHIASSINIPEGSEDEFERRFDKDKEIIVYCASEQCDASPKAAKELARRGFRRVRDYEAGMSDWKRAGRELERAASG
jgi:rhodanese-related sulfurtransferase